MGNAMANALDHPEGAAATIAARAMELAALAQKIVRDGEGFAPQARRADLDQIAESLARNRELLEKVAQETESARAVLFAGGSQRDALAVAARYRPTQEEIARANATFQQKMDPAMFDELVRQGAARRAAAVETAQTLLDEEPDLNQLAQTQPTAVRRSLEILAMKLPDRDTIIRWLNTEQPDLDMQTPLHVMRQGYAVAVEGMLENALHGIPS